MAPPSEKRRFLRFASIGTIIALSSYLTLFLLKIAFQWMGSFAALVPGTLAGILIFSSLHAASIADTVNALLSVEANFFANRRFTYSDLASKTKKGFIQEFVYFNISKIALTIPLNRVLFNLQLIGFQKLHSVNVGALQGTPIWSFTLSFLDAWGYLVAHTVCIAAITIVNYIGNKFIYRKGPQEINLEDLPTMEMPAIDELNYQGVRGAGPPVCVIIPCRNNQKTIGKVVQNLFEQRSHYDGEIHVILVGNKNDKTWSGIPQVYFRHDLDHPNERFLNICLLREDMNHKERDANLKRHEGSNHALREFSPENGDMVLIYTDADNPPHRNWIYLGVHKYMLGHNLKAVGGAMETEESLKQQSPFWTDYVDKNRFGAKTPRVPYIYAVTQENFGIGMFMPPITANFFVWASVYKKVYNKLGYVFDPRMRKSFEDYEATYVLVRDGNVIIHMIPELTIPHYHRLQFRTLMKDMYRAGEGCRDLMHYYPDAPLSKTRENQLRTVIRAGIGGSVITLALIAAIALLNAFWIAWLAISVTAALVIAFCIYLAMKTNGKGAFFYPFITFFLVISYCIGMINRGRYYKSGKIAKEETQIMGAVLVNAKPRLVAKLDTMKIASVNKSGQVTMKVQTVTGEVTLQVQAATDLQNTPFYTSPGGFVQGPEHSND